MVCAKCGRTAREIVLDSVEITKIAEKTEVDVFYVSVHDKLVCPSCVSEHMPVLKYEALPYLRYMPSTGKMMGIKGVHIDTEPYPEETEVGAEIEEVARIDRAI